ncbi:MAG: hypothetical protein HC837_08310 [Chloroflexaceae bacterium]|nr:hypothetical protein [Chloroflexaceae bacterium]
MTTVLVDLLPLIIGAALLPVWIIITLLLLRSEGGLWKALAFVGGSTLVKLAQGLLFGMVFDTAYKSNDYYTDTNPIAATLQLIVGILMMITAIKKWNKEDDPDAPPPRWMTMFSGVSVVQTLGIGVLLTIVAIKQWVFTLSALSIITQALLTQTEGALTFVIYVLASQSLLLAPIIISAIAPTRSASLLDTAQTWLERHNRVLMIAASSIFGIWFLWKGITGLIN